MTTRTVKRTTKPSVSEPTFAQRLKNFLNLKAQLELSETHLNALKTDLSGEVETAGYKDDKGHYWFDLDEPVEANVYDDKTDEVKTATFTKVKRQRTVSAPLNEQAAHAILSKKGVLEECQTTIVVLDEEKINRVYFEGKLTKGDIEKIFPQKITWSFRPQKG
jgi:hypothetical protein